MIFDWMFSAWMLSTIALMLTIISLVVGLRRRLFKIERKLENQDEKIFQLALLYKPQIPTLEYQEEKKKGGWPKGKTRKGNQQIRAPEKKEPAP